MIVVLSIEEQIASKVANKIAAYAIVYWYDSILMSSGEASPTFGHSNAIFSVYRPYKESISKEMNNDD